MLSLGRKRGPKCVELAAALTGLAAVLVAFLPLRFAGAAAVTQRMGTGLSAAGTAEGLPQAWVAPAGKAPVVDGRLDDEAWRAARPISLGKLENLGDVSPATRLRLVRHGGVLYVAAEMEEPRVAQLKRSVANADGPVYEDDSIELFLSPRPRDGYCQLIIGAAGAAFDRRGHGDPAAFDAGAKAAVAVGKNAWTVEAAIPMEALGAGREPPERWRANFYRNRRAGGAEESQAWSPTLGPDYDVPERFGHLLLAPTSPWTEHEQTARRQQGITIDDLGGGRAAVRFDLSTIPPGAKVYRAELVCERRPPDPADASPPGAVEIYPLAAAYGRGMAPGTEPRTDTEPLALMRPWYRSFDMTELVGQWVAGLRPNHGLLVRSFSGWRKEATFLDVMYEGAPEGVPPQAGRFKAFHRAGQTFLTWQEIEDRGGRDEIRWGELKALLDDLDREHEVRYCVYRSAEPITADTLPRAERIAVVEPLSCWNTNGRNISRPIDEFIATAKVLEHHQWNPFRDASIDGPFGRDCPIDRLVIAEGEGPLGRGTGLYVHTAASSRKSYYAVVSRIDGVENTADFGPGNSLARPVDETVAPPEPVLQGELPRMPFFNYDQRRLHFVRWVAPPLTNLPSDYFNWSVGVPNDPAKNPPLELNLHRDGYDYWRTAYRIEPQSIVLSPHDFPRKTFWYGYHEACGTLRPWSEGFVRNYTERRLLWFVDWAARRFAADRRRITVTGIGGGASGSGALHLGLRYPEVFNLVVAGHGEPDYRVVADGLVGVWGKPEWQLKAALDEGPHGALRSVWEELDLVRHVKDLPPAADLPLVSMTYSNQQPGAEALFQALSAARQPVLSHTAWGGQRLVPVSAAATFPWRVPLEVRKGTPLLAVTTSGEVRDAVRNGSLVWQSDSLVDRPELFAATIEQGPGELTGSITLRRLQNFRVVPGRRYTWTLEPLGAAAVSAGRSPTPQQGIATAEDDGLLTLNELKIKPGTYRLSVVPKVNR